MPINELGKFLTMTARTMKDMSTANELVEACKFL